MKNFKKYFVLSALCLIFTPYYQEIHAQDDDVEIEEEDDEGAEAPVTPIASPSAPTVVTQQPVSTAPATSPEATAAKTDDVDIEDIEEKPAQPPSGAPITAPQQTAIKQAAPKSTAKKPKVQRSFLDPFQTQLAQKAASSKKTKTLKGWQKQRSAPKAKVRSARTKNVSISKGKAKLAAERAVAGRVIPKHSQAKANTVAPLTAAQKQAQVRAQQRAALLRTRRLKFAQPKKKQVVKRPKVKIAPKKKTTAKPSVTPVVPVVGSATTPSPQQATPTPVATSVVEAPTAPVVETSVPQAPVTAETPTPQAAVTAETTESAEADDVEIDE